MAEPDFSADELAALWGSRPSGGDATDELAALLGTDTTALFGASPSVADLAVTAPVPSEIDALVALVGDATIGAHGPVTTSPSVEPAAGATAGSAVARGAPQPAEETYAWLDAIHLIPKFEKLMRNYPPITTTTDPKYGRVIVLAYLEDKVRGIRRNFKIGSQMFFDVDEIDRVEPETKALKCRILIKTIPYQVGLRIRCWEHRPGGDDPRKKGLIVARDRGLAFEERPAVLLRGGK